MRLLNSVCVVTGGASGLGAATARLLSQSGAKVVIWDMNEQEGKSLESELSPNSLFCKVNIGETESIESAIKETLSKFSQINALVNCAGVPFAAWTLYKGEVHPLDSFEYVFRINVIGTFNVSRLVAKQMVSQPMFGKDRGVIINVASVAGFEGQQGTVAYSSSKGAVIGMTLPLARDLAYYKIRVATLAPGPFETKMGSFIAPQVSEKLIKAIPLRRFGQASEFALAAKFIIENQYITGQTLRIDGGVVLPNL